MKFSETPLGSFGVALNDTKGVRHFKLLKSKDSKGFVCFDKNYPTGSLCSGVYMAVYSFVSKHKDVPFASGAVSLSQPLIRPKGDGYMSFLGNVGSLADVDPNLIGPTRLFQKVTIRLEKRRFNLLSLHFERFTENSFRDLRSIRSSLGIHGSI